MINFLEGEKIKNNFIKKYFEIKFIWFVSFLTGVFSVFLTLPANAEADIKAGAKIFNKCKSCHMVGEGARNRTGPHLNGLFGRPLGSIEGFKYSKDMKRAAASGLIWDNEHVDMFIENPKSLVFGTRMTFRGIKDKQDRANLIAFLRQFSDNPSDIPEAEPTLAAKDPDVHPSILAIKGDPEYGAYLSGECTTCHRLSGEDDGIPSIVGWHVEDFVTALHAYKNGYRPHEVMGMVAKRLSEEEIAALAAYFSEQEID